MEKIKYYTLSQEERIKIEKKIKDILSHDENIIFAFIHGVLYRVIHLEI
ncbi:MAG: hypothetical protein J7L07_05125 [Candidatus Odinarchaeota archaeon]|nr:hypothetical protein [Candidatus Odinarchaeota archaeon]